MAVNLASVDLVATSIAWARPDQMGKKFVGNFLGRIFVEGTLL
jgi:hypothetical protein